MASESFQRLPQHIQNIVTGGLEEEIKDAFSKIEHARKADDVDEEQIRFYEGDIVKASELRAALTGEDVKP